VELTMTRLRCLTCHAVFLADSEDLSPEGCASCGSIAATHAPALPRAFAHHQAAADEHDAGYEIRQLIAEWEAQAPGCETDVDNDIRALVAEFTEPSTPPLARASEAIRPGQRGLAS
jgi:predicted  nucleic acid-binding Zn-ribbon protein